MTSQETMKHSLKPGEWFTNIAKVDEPQNWVITEAPLPEDGDPNSFVYADKLFGYSTKEFLSKQYKGN